MKRIIHQQFSVKYNYPVYFTEDLFDVKNHILRKIIKKQAAGAAKTLFVIDSKVAEAIPTLCDQIVTYTTAHEDVMHLSERPICVVGSEVIKNDREIIKMLYQHINEDGICRHSYVVAIGGGALLDAVGFVAATAHRGIRLIRIPTTVLSQDDSGVGVKNGINYFGKKNYVGTFAPPYAVVNDFNFIRNLPFRDWVSGIAEAVKVSLIKDADLFHYIQQNFSKVLKGKNEKKNEKVMQEIICRSAELHLRHIGTQGDPFELGSSRPLDFGHWSAHKLEQITNHRLRHGEAVAIGVALDSTYSYLIGLLTKQEWEEIIETMKGIGFNLYVPELSQEMGNPEHPDSIFKGLVEFREHLGGELTIMMLEKIGKGKEIHIVDFKLYQKAINLLKEKAIGQMNIIRVA